MGFKVKVELQGLATAIAKLKDLDKKIQKRVLRKSVNSGSQEIVRAVKQTAPRDSGLLRKKTAKKVKVYKGKVVAVVGPRRFKDPATGRNAANYAHLAEDGAKPHMQSGSVPFQGGWIRVMHIQHPGARGHRFMKRAAAQADGAAVRAFTAKLQAELAIEAR